MNIKAEPDIYTNRIIISLKEIEIIPNEPTTQDTSSNDWTTKNSYIDLSLKEAKLLLDTLYCSITSCENVTNILKKYTT